MNRRYRTWIESGLKSKLLGGVIALVLAGEVSAQIPIVQNLGLLPGDRLTAPGFNSQQDHAAAAGGNQQLVVWSDYRSQNSGNATNQSAGDIFGIRLDADGNPIDSMPFPICVEQGEQRYPEVAWNGQSWLVVYRSQDTVDSYFANRIRAVRVSSTGVVLDQTPLVIASSDLPFRVAGQSGQWLVSFTQYDANGSSAFAAGTRVGDQGQILDSPPLTLLDSNYGAAALLAANGEYLIAAPHASDPSITRARRLNLNGQPIGLEFTLPSSNLGTRGSEYYVTWISNFTNLVGSRMTLEGVLLDPEGELLTTEYSQYHHNAISHDGLQWWVEWGAANLIQTLRVSNSGVVLDANGGLTLPLSAVDIARDPLIVPRSSGGLLFYWWDGRGADSNVYRLPISSTNQVQSERCVSVATPTQLAPDFAKGANDQVAVTWVSHQANDDRVLVHFLSSVGAVERPEPIQVARGPNFGKASIAWNGACYLVSWDEGDAGLTPTRVVARRLRPDGTFIDAAPLSVLTGYSPDVDAVEDDFLIAASRFVTFQTIAVHAKRVDGSTGAVLDPAPLVLLNGYVSTGPRVQSDGKRWLVTYHSHWSSNSSQSDVVYNFVQPNGTFTSAANPASSSGGAGHLAVAYSGSRYLFVWRSNTLSSANNYISGKIMNANGTFATSDFVIAEAAGRQLQPAVAWDGTEFVVTWDDQRHQRAFFDERTDIYAARVTPTGVVLDPAGIPVMTHPNGEVTSAVVGTHPGVALVAAAQFATTATYDSYRIGISALGLPTVPADLSGVDVRQGTLLAGTVDSLRASDRSYLSIRSAPTSTRPVTELQVWAFSTVENPGSVRVSIDSRTSLQTSDVQVLARNWLSNSFETVDKYQLDRLGSTRTLQGLAGNKFVSPAGEIELRFLHQPSPSHSTRSFQTHFDSIRIELGN